MADIISNARVICVQSDVISIEVSLINELISKNRAKADEIHWFCYDLCSSDLRHQSSTNTSSSSRIYIHDCFPWRLDCKEFSGKHILEIVSKPVSKKMTIIVDSFSTLLEGSSVIEANELLQKICWDENDRGNHVIQIFLILRGSASLNAVKTVKHLQFLTKAWLIIRPNLITVKTLKSSGKVITQVYEYRVDNERKLFLNSRKVGVPCGIEPTKENVDTTALCTFKLDLTDQEKQDRNAVELPYIKSSDKKKHVSNAQIHYNPDEYDDWDEEEPDNDLEFFQ